jgi:hypothetical protein
MALRHKSQIQDTNEAETMSAQFWNQLYEIRFEGHLSWYRAQMFEELEMVQEPGGETVLTGPIRDQAALHGVLNRIRDLGVPLLSVKRLSQDEAKTERGVRNAAHD